MDRTKFAEGSISILSRMVCKAGWKSGPMSQDNVLAPAFAIGACFVESSNRIWGGFAVQTAEGQAIVLTLLEAQLDGGRPLAARSPATQKMESKTLRS